MKKILLIFVLLLLFNINIILSADNVKCIRDKILFNDDVEIDWFFILKVRGFSDVYLYFDSEMEKKEQPFQTGYYLRSSKSAMGATFKQFTDPTKNKNRYYVGYNDHTYAFTTRKNTNDFDQFFTRQTHGVLYSYGAHEKGFVGWDLEDSPVSGEKGNGVFIQHSLPYFPFPDGASAEENEKKTGKAFNGPVEEEFSKKGTTDIEKVFALTYYGWKSGQEFYGPNLINYIPKYIGFFSETTDPKYQRMSGRTNEKDYINLIQHVYPQFSSSDGFNPFNEIFLPSRKPTQHIFCSNIKTSGKIKILLKLLAKMTTKGLYTFLNNLPETDKTFEEALKPEPTTSEEWNGKLSDTNFFMKVNTNQSQDIWTDVMKQCDASATQPCLEIFDKSRGVQQVKEEVYISTWSSSNIKKAVTDRGIFIPLMQTELKIGKYTQLVQWQGVTTSEHSKIAFKKTIAKGNRSKWNVCVSGGNLYSRPDNIMASLVMCFDAPNLNKALIKLVDPTGTLNNEIYKPFQNERIPDNLSADEIKADEQKNQLDNLAYDGDTSSKNINQGMSIAFFSKSKFIKSDRIGLELVRISDVLLVDPEFIGNEEYNKLKYQYFVSTAINIESSSNPDLMAVNEISAKYPTEEQLRSFTLTVQALIKWVEFNGEANLKLNLQNYFKNRMEALKNNAIQQQINTISKSISPHSVHSKLTSSPRMPPSPIRVFKPEELKGMVKGRGGGVDMAIQWAAMASPTKAADLNRNQKGKPKQRSRLNPGSTSAGNMPNNVAKVLFPPIVPPDKHQGIIDAYCSNCKLDICSECKDDKHKSHIKEVKQETEDLQLNSHQYVYIVNKAFGVKKIDLKNSTVTWILKNRQSETKLGPSELCFKDHYRHQNSVVNSKIFFFTEYALHILDTSVDETTREWVYHTYDHKDFPAMRSRSSIYDGRKYFYFFGGYIYEKSSTIKEVVRFNTKSLKLKKIGTIPSSSSYLAPTRCGNLIYLIDTSSLKIYRFDTITHKSDVLVKNFNVEKGITGCFVHHLQTMYLFTYDGGFYKMDLNTDKSPVPLINPFYERPSSHPLNAYYQQLDHSIYLLAEGENCILKYDINQSKWSRLLDQDNNSEFYFSVYGYATFSNQ
ncbi:hypothetical protein DLAC_01157 [Tieghemostelium lacteum]|uniref:Uncharacterized protein n=1 Tax=Tieghemostelium lacteum TaxID=361077 RepID=A0A152A7X9_TIELA|nr:hypothetical protein DLAC_01157 [Tieghemostelium lacteum]|eukprot:KYR02326.1 hypothetical protein DLAC_01157 [Tieghemostelium lacteum]